MTTEPAELELFAESLGADDEVVLEATGNALAIARNIDPHVARVVLAHPKAVKRLTQAGPKTDKIDLRRRPATSDLFGVAGRRWLAEQELPTDEREMVEACLRKIDFLGEEVTRVDRALAELALT